MRKLLSLLSFLVGLAFCQKRLVRINCAPEPNSNQKMCISRGCIWSAPIDPSDEYEPWCYFPPGVGYTFDSSKTANTVVLKKNKGISNPWGADFPQIVLTTKSLGSTLNVKIAAPTARFEPPVDLPMGSSQSTESLLFKENRTSDPYFFQIVRSSTQQVLFDTSLGGLIFSDQFLQIATFLPSESITTFSRYTTWDMLTRDEPPDSANLDTKNLYGVHPYNMVVEEDGKAHGVLILNSNAQEVTTAPGPAWIYRTIGGVLDIYFFPGPTPEQVTQQYLALIGKPFLPAYWALGYQLSRYGYKNLDEMKARIDGVRKDNIPIDIAVADIDYMDRYKDFTTGTGWENFPAYIKQLHDWKMRLILIFDPAIDVTYPSFQRAMNAGARFIEWETMQEVQRNIQDMYPTVKNTKIMLGVVWPDNHVAFPDFLDSTGKTQKWWADEFTKFRSQIEFDGIWIDMNEPSNFGTNDPHPFYFDMPDHPNISVLTCQLNNSWDTPPYPTYSVWRYGKESSLATKTLCMKAVQDNNKLRFYNTKNLYGWSEAKATLSALYQATGKRGAVVSRSTFPSAGRYTGHWLGDNTARWQDLRTSIIGAQEFNLFGIPYVGSDVCGFGATTNDELCLRWQQMGAFHSFFRNHNDKGSPAEDPAEWPDVAEATRQANLFRYRHLPYLYSLHMTASLEGGTVFRPIFFEFPTDPRVLDLGHQFMWGPAMLVAPVVLPDVVTRTLYLPSDIWYSLTSYNYGLVSKTGDVQVPAPKTSLIPIYVRGGYIIPRQAPNMTLSESRKNPFELLIALDGNQRANGVFYWDDGESLFTETGFHKFEFSFSHEVVSSKLTILHKKNTTVDMPTLDVLEIFNYPSTPDLSSFRVGGLAVDMNRAQINYDVAAHILTISKPGLVNLATTR
ncbi:unnamed protein product [Caenorhabditis auriculariae]|uniref:P-type domain-containing protein n=1 Tax=Caenorhabditis auriculariae TaxID=2777116 RepID=A0A8S1HAK4_9PELO|nr:unnamed protein product [Caenorhabditis auriculariae]